MSAQRRQYQLAETGEEGEMGGQVVRALLHTFEALPLKYQPRGGGTGGVGDGDGGQWVPLSGLVGVVGGFFFLSFFPFGVIYIMCYVL